MFNSFRRPSSSGVASSATSSRPSTPTTHPITDPMTSATTPPAPVLPSMCPPEPTSLRCLVCQQDSSSSGAKVPLYDSILTLNTPASPASGVGTGTGTGVSNRPRRLHSPQLELIAQMMFGATPLSHKGRSTKLHEFRLPTSALFATHHHPSVPAATAHQSSSVPSLPSGPGSAIMATASPSTFTCQHATEPPSTTAPNAILVTSLFSISLAHLDHSIRTKLSASNNASDPSSLGTSYASSLVGLVPTVLSSSNPTSSNASAQPMFDLSSIPMDQLKLAARRLTRSMYAIGLILPCTCPKFRHFVLSQLATIERLMLRVQAHVSRLVLSGFIHSWQPSNSSSVGHGMGGRGLPSRRPGVGLAASNGSSGSSELRYSMQDTLTLAMDDLRDEIVRIYLDLATPSPFVATVHAQQPPPTPALSRRFSVISMSSTRSSIMEEGARRASLAPRSEADVLPVPPPSMMLSVAVAVLLTCTRRWFAWAMGAPGMDVHLVDHVQGTGDVDSDFRVAIVGGGDKEAAGWVELVGLIMDPPPASTEHARADTGIGEEDEGEDEHQGGTSVTMAGGVSTSTVITEIGPTAATDSYPFVSAMQAPMYPGPSTSPLDSATDISSHSLTSLLSPHFLPSLPLQSLASPLSPLDYVRIRLEAAESIAIQGFSSVTSTILSSDGCSAASPIWADIDRPCTLLIVDIQEHRLLLVTARAFDEALGDATIPAISPWEHLWTASTSPVDSLAMGPLVLTGLGPAGRCVYTNVVPIPLSESSVPPVVAQLVSSVFLSAVQFDRATAVAHLRQVLGHAVASRVVACTVLALGKEERNPVVCEERIVPIKAWGALAKDDGQEGDEEEEEVGVSVVADLLGCSARDVAFVRYLCRRMIG